MSGTVWVHDLREDQLEEMQERYPTIEVRYDAYTTFTVNYYVGNTLEQAVSGIAWGATPTYSGDDPVMPDVDDPENYTFVGWYPVPQYVECDMNVSAVFRRNDILALKILDGTLSGDYVNDRITELRAYALQETQVTSVYFPAVRTAGTRAFYNCSKLTRVTAPRMTVAAIATFLDCKSLETVDVYQATASQAFWRCTALTALILRRQDAVSTGLDLSYVFAGTPIEAGTGYIYVPSALLADYQTKYAAQTWVTQFRAIEDYPEITGG